MFYWPVTIDRPAFTLYQSPESSVMCKFFMLRVNA